MSGLNDFIKKKIPKNGTPDSGSGPATPNPKPLADHQNTNKKRILVLDDDPTFGELIMRYQNKYEVDVEFFENVHQFVERLSEQKFDVVILDYFLEGYVGTQLASLIQGTPVVLVSNKNSWQEADPSLTPTASRFVHKKAGPDKILAEALALARR